ncbi:hypothetical protein VUR80DRAFT_6985 [Thermomyces stellatus]
MLIVNGTETEPWKYIRNVQHAQYTPYHENPTLDLNSENMRCGRNATISGRESGDVATAVSGDVVGFVPSGLVCPTLLWPRLMPWFA